MKVFLFMCFVVSMTLWGLVEIGRWDAHRRCRMYGEATERQVKWENDVCYVKTSTGWYNYKQIRSN